MGEVPWEPRRLRHSVGIRPWSSEAEGTWDKHHVTILSLSPNGTNPRSSDDADEPEISLSVER